MRKAIALVIAAALSGFGIARAQQFLIPQLSSLPPVGTQVSTMFVATSASTPVTSSTVETSIVPTSNVWGTTYWAPVAGTTYRFELWGNAKFTATGAGTLKIKKGSTVLYATAANAIKPGVIITTPVGWCLRGVTTATSATTAITQAQFFIGNGAGLQVVYDLAATTTATTINSTAENFDITWTWNESSASDSIVTTNDRTAI